MQKIAVIYHDDFGVKRPRYTGQDVPEAERFVPDRKYCCLWSFSGCFCQNFIVSDYPKGMLFSHSLAVLVHHPEFRQESHQPVHPAPPALQYV